MPKYEPNYPYIMSEPMKRHLLELLEKLTPEQISDDSTKYQLATGIVAPIIEALADEVPPYVVALRPRAHIPPPSYLPGPNNEAPITQLPPKPRKEPAPTFGGLLRETPAEATHENTEETETK